MRQRYKIPSRRSYGRRRTTEGGGLEHWHQRFASVIKNVLAEHAGHAEQKRQLNVQNRNPDQIRVPDQNPIQLRPFFIFSALRALRAPREILKDLTFTTNGQFNPSDNSSVLCAPREIQS